MKYHENLQGQPGEHRARYDEIAEQMGCFDPGNLVTLRAAPIQQIWRDHLLTGAARIVDGYEDALFAVIYPKDNAARRDAVATYRSCLTERSSFVVWTLEEVAAQLKAASSAAWIDLFIDRYLSFVKVDRRLSELDAGRR